MNHFDYQDGELHCEGVSLTDIAREVGTPVYVYSSATLERHYNVFAGALNASPALRSPKGEAPLVAYAMKANSNLAVVRTLALQGCGADTVSEGEIRKALTAGVPAEKIVFSGVGKTDAEMAFALKTGIYQLNVESRPELDRLARVAASLNMIAPFVIRINPGVGSGGHAKITTGGARDKFGISAEEALKLYAEAAAHRNLAPVGIACHIGSQITDLTPLQAAFSRMKGWVEALRAEGLSVERLDLGGGLGVPYFNQPEPPHPVDFAEMAALTVGTLGVRYTFEPGRVIAANAGVLVSRVVHVHERTDSGQKFLVLDAAMNDLIRPALYDAYHDIRPVAQPTNDDSDIYDVVGPVCETGDTFTRNRELPRLRADELVAFMSAGAYGAVMGSEYNSRPLAPEVLVRDGGFAVVRPRPSYDEMMAREPLPQWLELGLEPQGSRPRAASA
ncbi:diaminopimelate decarboxylase [Asticcacaulis sp. AC460]|uniref:diaminopimelate decarboxylase n=1 Tax=Asticcacaulis sp. AC460 TaxID=1282360 RepID=UPI0003C3EB4E|nr:diaminopimelate decarboxylase [Asticcacaulis sp. AC460]ESQ92992.1 diaminopimelate decarboxylase [Asticcacaulis sp. AC460]